MNVRAALGVLAVALGLAALAPSASAHQTAVKYVELTVDRDDRSYVEIKLRAHPSDFAEVVGRPADAELGIDDLQHHEAAMERALASWIKVEDARGGGRQGLAVVDPDHDHAFVVVTGAAWRDGPFETLRIDLSGLFALDPRQSVVLRVVSPDQDDFSTIVRASDPRLTIPLAAGRPSTTGAWLRAGADHIYGGHDHLAFVLLLVMVIGLGRQPVGGWALRPVGSALRRTAAVVTAFTIAHCGTLIATSLGWFSLPARVVESLIAGSILYTAIENIVRPDTRWRSWQTFGFGLVHGMGFASVLAELLPARDVIRPLLTFNLGIELGQLSIIVVAVPLVMLLGHVIGATRYRRVAMPVLSGTLGLLGALWLIERVGAVSLLGGF